MSELERKYDGNKCDVKKVRDDDARICENKLKNFYKGGLGQSIIKFLWQKLYFKKLRSV